jgi:DNA polymerase III subunit gamma/tau
LKIAWQEYILKLKAAMKHSVVSTFEMMECRMKTPLDFEVQVYGNIQFGFLKQEKTELLQHVQAFFKNPNINILVQMTEEPEDLTPVEKPLSTKEQFMRMTEKYPLVKDLKDRLGLELDY